MNKIQQLTLASAQAIADQVANSNDASAAGIVIAVTAGNDGHLFYNIATTRNGALESTRLLCSATSMGRLEGHLVVFIDNVKNPV